MKNDYEKLCSILSEAVPTQVRRTIIVSEKEHENLDREIRYLANLIDTRDSVCRIARNHSLLKQSKA
ncbi:MAG: hypothetical protein ACRD5H_01430 [Nitrososphaerales archaeon]